jgi:hypothetical protein
MMTDEWLRGVMMYGRWKGRRWMKYAQRSHEYATQGMDATTMA